MPKDYAALPINQIRRADRAVEDEAWIKAFLHKAAFGTLATAHDGQPFINSNLYAYDEAAHCLYMHTAAIGRTRANIDYNPRFCFSVMEMGRVLPADTAFDFSLEYSGVVIFGQGAIVQDPDEARHGLQLLLDKYAPHLKPDIDYRSPNEDELKRTAVYRLNIETWSGKRRTADADFPGAFDYNAR